MSVEICGAHVVISPVMSRSSNAPHVPSSLAVREASCHTLVQMALQVPIMIPPRSSSKPACSSCTAAALRVYAGSLSGPMPEHATELLSR